MSTRLTQLLLGLSLLLNCFVLAGFVYRSWIAPPPIARPGLSPGGPQGRGPIEALSQELKLDEPQRQALHGVFEQYAKSRHDRFLEIGKIREEMVGELKKPQFDLGRIDSLIDQVTKLRADQQKENLASIAQLAPQLRPEQSERLHAILADRYGGAGMGPGGRPGGSGRGPGPGQGRPPQ
jgi:Spy/CpxP family protein refolding chaperone